MPITAVRFFRNGPEDVPVLDWLVRLRKKDAQAYAKCVAAIRMLRAFGHELRRPHADMLRDGVRELRIRKGRVNYRILYFFHGRDAAILAHALTKVDKVPEIDIDRAVRRKSLFEQNPEQHTAAEEIDDG